MRRAGIAAGAVGYGPGDHLCWVHDGEAAWRDAATTFLDDGAHGPDRLLYMADKDERGLVDDLASLPGRDAMLAAGQLVVLPLSSAYGHDHVFEATRQLAVVDGEVLATADAGYRTLRLAAEVTSLAATDDDVRRFAGFELLLDAVVAKAKLSALCGVDGRRVGERAARQVCFVHPLRAGGAPPAGGLHADEGGRWRLRGEIDVEAHVALEAALAALPVSDEVHFNLGDLAFIDVRGTRALVALAERLAPDGQVVLHDPPAALLLVLESGWGAVPGVHVAVS